jgi:hypothetical protein
MATAGARRWRGVIESHLGSRDVARVIYGAIVGLAVVVVLEDHPPGAGAVAAALAATALAVGLAELYSEVVATEARTRRQLRVVQVRVFALDAMAVFVGAGFPALFFVAASLGWLELDVAFTLAKWTGLALICAYGYLGARLSGSRRGIAIVEALAVGAIGGILIGLKALVHW